jgi:7-cyano-7-deazaguanine synthase
MTGAPKRAVVLVSGGLDSTTALAVARRDGFETYALSFDYGQRHVFELDAARKVSQAAQVKRHLTVKVDLRSIGGSSLTADIPVPKDRQEADMSTGIPPTYVPARNTVFLSLALGWGETLDAFAIYLGVNAIDYSGYPDCRPEYIAAFERLANLATKAGVEGAGAWKIHTPLIHMTKAEIIKTGTALGVDYSLTHSCYDPDEAGRSCGHCDSCTLRLKGFAEAGLQDPVQYQSRRKG